jgi:hypothetical protein
MSPKTIQPTLSYKTILALPTKEFSQSFSFGTTSGGGSPPTLSLIEGTPKGSYNKLTRIILANRGEKHEIDKAKKRKLQYSKGRAHLQAEL